MGAYQKGKMRRFVIGDIHGAYKALVQVFARCEFSLEKDLLICLGDVCDGWPEVRECLDLLMQVKNLKYVWGNHDEWAHEWMRTYYFNPDWWYQGGTATVQSFGEISDDIDAMRPYREFFYNAVYWHHIHDEKSPDTVFVHGGFDWNYRIEEHQKDYHFTWNRRLIGRAMQNQIIADKQKLVPKNVTKHSRVFLGHTSLRADVPGKFCEVWNMDTGAGWSGTLSIMDIDTEEYWTSDNVLTLYPGTKGRD